MLNGEIKIQYLYHSSFTLETTNYFLVFDYFHDTPNQLDRCKDNGFLSLEDFNLEKDIYVFVTHSHSDHFNPLIFKWQEVNPNIKYILSCDVEVTNKKDNYYFMDKYDGIEFDGMKIEALGSTDKGVSYYIEVDGYHIFHSGDLNWWHWKEFSNEKQLQEEIDYKNELKYLAGKFIDIAFVPVDPRLEEHCHLAGEYFIEVIKPQLLIPMHFADNMDVTVAFSEKLSDKPTTIPIIHKRGQLIHYSKDY